MRFATVVACVAACSLLGNSASASNPRFRHLSPLAAQRGNDVEVFLYGDNLNDAEELLLYDSGMQVTKFELVTSEEEKKQGKRIKVTFKIAPDCPLGTQRMRIRTRTGMSDLMTFHVGALPVVAEKEPNTDFASPQVLEKNVSVEGRVDREDVDYFVIEAKKGERISAEVFGTRLGRSSGTTYFDPYLAILNSERFELAVSDDSPLLWNDSTVSLIAPEDGKYIIQLRDASYNGDGQAYYVLHVGNFPRPLAAMPAGGKPGEKLAVTFLGDVSGPMTREITLPSAVSPDRFGLEVSDDQGVAPSPQPFRLVDLPNVLEQEPNNDRTTATAGPTPVAFNGVISEKGDIDFFKFSAKKDQQLNIEVYARRLRSGLDPVVSVHQAQDGRTLGSDDDAKGQDCLVKFKAPADGDYVVAVRDHLNSGDPTFVYRIEISPPQPELHAEPIEFARYVQHQIIIPQGGGCGIVANIQRADFGGPVNFRSDSLPAGVRVECPESWRADGTASVVFYADENAPLSGKFSTITAYLDDPKQPNLKVEGLLRQDVLMVRARNNDRVWEERMYRMPVVVVEKAPYKCWIEIPKVPLVKNGSMNLLVRCEKAEGWDEEINLQLLQDPPGIRSNHSAKIPKGSTEGVISVNAADNASIRESMISVRCQSKYAGGDYEVCTPFVPLRVEEKYVILEFAQGAIEQGKETPYVVKVTKQKDFDGEATVELLGLPANATAEKLTLKKDTQELLFTIKAGENTPVGMNQNLFCRVDIPEQGEIIVHNLGSGRLRVDKPAPMPQTNPQPTPQPAAAPVAQTAAPPKPLSRLEQLRLQQKQKEQGGGGGE